MTVPLLDVFRAELLAHDIALCAGGCAHGRGHKRGFVMRGERTIHLDSSVATRSTLFRALHEVGHVLNSGTEKGQKSFEREAGANRYATETMRAHGLSVPRRVYREWGAYVERKKRHGARVAAGLRGVGA